MPFLRKITGSGHSHSRSGSASSIKAWSLDSPTSLERHSTRPTKSSRKSGTSEYRNSVASSGSCGNSNTAGHDNGTGLLVVPDIDEFTNSPQMNDKNNLKNDSRNPSGGSINSLSFDKLILSWDPTDPDEWSMQRVSSWLKFHEFPESWIVFFKKYQLSGHKFIKLLAHDNFAVYEKYLPQSKYASYTRFQNLLKQTMSKNVTNNHIRQKSTEKAKESRSSSESLKSKHKKANSLQEATSSRSASESALSPTTLNSSKSDDKLGGQPLRTHQKTSSASALYRRSLISLRGSSTGNLLEGKTPSNIKLNIPSRPQSIVETNGSSKPGSPPNSPHYPGLFRRHQKSSSSESSLLNALFGSQSNVTIDDEQDKSSYQTANASADSLSKGKHNAIEGNTVSSNISSPNPIEEKSSLWGKLRRRSQLIVPANVPQSPQLVTLNPASSLSTPNIGTPPTASDASIGTLTPKYTDVKTAQATPSSSKRHPIYSTDRSNRNDNNDTYTPASFLLDKKFYPLKTKDSQDDIYILITKDNRSFIPMNIGMIESLEELKESVTLMLSINHNDITIHLTDFGCEIGSALPDDTLESLRSSLFLNTAGKLYIKDQSKSSSRPRAATLSNEMNHSVKSLKSKNSFRSVTNSMMYSTDEVSIVTSSSDLTSFDDHASGTARRYPQTPSHYYDAVAANNGEEINYWNYKDPAQEASKSPRPLRSSSQVKKEKYPPFELAPEKGRMGSFQILRKEDSNEIDFNKRRESPYVQPELAPRREAPKPPTNSSPQKSLSISSRVSTPRLRRSSTRRKAPGNPKLAPPSPSGEAVSPSSDSVVNSYTPGSSHVLVPQPYKGASEGSRKLKTEDEQMASSISAFISKQRTNRSDSIASNSGSVRHMRSPPLGRGNSRRIVSSASAADVFDENDITFADAPEFTDSGSDSSDDIIWSTSGKSRETETEKEGIQRNSSGDNSQDRSQSNEENDGGAALNRKMTLRPSPEVVYQNLEKFFPHANLDKPVLEGVTPPASPRSVDTIGMSRAFGLSNAGNSSNSSTPAISPNKSTKQSFREDEKGFLRDRLPKRAKTIRTIAHEASEARKQSVKLGRQNTKMWGTKTVEVTDKRMVSINNTKNSRGQYKEFAWIKGEMIGKGSFGAVYLCLNVTTGEMMAVKQVEVPKYGSQNEQIIHTVEALRAEMSTLKNLDHLNIVQYLGFEAKDNMNSLFLEYVAGGSVGSLIRMYGRFDEVMIKHLTTQVLRGLSYLHSRGILHRDMKADNLLLDQEGVCKISDFGISRKSKDIYSNSEMTMRGTVFWMAPEMVDTAQGYSAKVDIWSMGCVVLEMFAGKRPWSNLEVVAAMFKIGKSKSAPPIPEDTLPLISQSGRDFIDACFQIDPEARPTADKLLSHPFILEKENFDFKSTKLAELIKSNDKVNSTKLRVSSHEKSQLEL